MFPQSEFLGGVLSPCTIIKGEEPRKAKLGAPLSWHMPLNKTFLHSYQAKNCARAVPYKCPNPWRT